MQTGHKEERKLEKQVNWLTAALGAQRGGLYTLVLRLKSLAEQTGESFSIHKKFMRLMNQVANERQKELKIIDKIEAIEKKHKELRRRNLLQRIAAKLEREHKLLKERLEKEGALPRRDCKEECAKPLSALGMVILFFLFARRPLLFYKTWGSLKTKKIPTRGTTQRLDIK